MSDAKKPLILLTGAPRRGEELRPPTGGFGNSYSGLDAFHSSPGGEGQCTLLQTGKEKLPQSKGAAGVCKATLQEKAEGQEEGQTVVPA